MGKPRRPKGGRSNWQPRPPLDAERPAPTEVSFESLPESLPESPPEQAAMSEAVPSPAGFADAEPVPASAPEAAAASVAPAEPEAEAHDGLTRTLDPHAADRDAEADREHADEHPHEHRAAGRAEPQTAFDAAPPPDLAPVMPHAAEPPVLNRIAFAPDRIDMTEIGSTIARYVQGEGVAALAHFRALSDVRTPADLIRLQVGEVQRAADASLTCWVTVMGKASRVVAFR